GAIADASRHGVSKAESVPEKHLREYRLRTENSRHTQKEGAGRNCGKKLAQCRAVGRGQGSPERECVRPVRRTAAASVPCPHPGGRAGGHSYGRADVRA